MSDEGTLLDGVYNLASVEYAQYIALAVERLLRQTNDPQERASLRAKRDYHFARLSNEKIAR